MSKTVQPTKAQLEELIEKNKPWWYHTMNLGQGLRTPGIYGVNLVPVASLMRSVEFSGLKCLDIGTMNGKMAFLMEKLGADVTAIDLGVRLEVIDMIELFQSKITTRYETGFQQLPQLREELGLYDFVLGAGNLYHLYSPVDYIFEIRKSLRHNGYAIIESACSADEVETTMSFNRGNLYQDYGTFWVPTIACLRYLVRYACFDIVAEATLKIPGDLPRHAILAKALNLEETRESSDDDWLKEVASIVINDGTIAGYFPHKQFETSEEAQEVKVNGLRHGTHYRLRSRKSKELSGELAYLEQGTPADIGKLSSKEQKALIPLFESMFERSEW